MTSVARLLSSVSLCPQEIKLEMKKELDACRAAIVDMQGRGDARERELKGARDGDSQLVLRLREVCLCVAVFCAIDFLF